MLEVSSESGGSKSYLDDGSWPPSTTSSSRMMMTSLDGCCRPIDDPSPMDRHHHHQQHQQQQHQQQHYQHQKQQQHQQHAPQDIQVDRHLQQMTIHGEPQETRLAAGSREELDGSSSVPARSYLHCGGGSSMDLEVVLPASATINTGTSPCSPSSPSSSLNNNHEHQNSSSCADEEADRTRTVWKMYTRTKGLFGPDSRRLENMSWRLMAFQGRGRSGQGTSIAAAAVSVCDSLGSPPPFPKHQQQQQQQLAPQASASKASASVMQALPASPSSTPALVPVCNSSASTGIISEEVTPSIPNNPERHPDETLPTLTEMPPSFLVPGNRELNVPYLAHMAEESVAVGLAAGVDHDLSLGGWNNLLTNEDYELAMNFLFHSGTSIPSTTGFLVGTDYVEEASSLLQNKLLEQAFLSGTSLDALDSSSLPSLDSLASLDSLDPSHILDPRVAIARERALQKQLLAVQSALRASQQRSLQSMLESPLDPCLLNAPVTGCSAATATLPSTLPSAFPSTLPGTLPSTVVPQNFICHHCRCTASDRWYQSTSFETPIILCRSCLEEFSGTKTVAPAAVHSPSITPATTATIDPATAFPSGSRYEPGEPVAATSSNLFLSPQPPKRESLAPKRSSGDAETSRSSGDGKSARPRKLSLSRSTSTHRRTSMGTVSSSLSTSNSTTSTSAATVPFAGSSATAFHTSCDNCGTTVTPLWRRGINNQCLCNACGLYFKLHQAMRPPSMKTETIKKRVRSAGPSDGKQRTPKQRTSHEETAPPQGMMDNAITVAATAAHDENVFMQSLVHESPSADILDEDMDGWMSHGGSSSSRSS